MYNTKASARRVGSVEGLYDTIRNVRERKVSTQYLEARAEAHRLMGIPDLNSKEYVGKNRAYVKHLNLLVKSVAEYISQVRESQGFILGDKAKLEGINKRIEASNEYRKTNPFLLMKMPMLKALDLHALEELTGFFYVIPVKTCGFGSCPHANEKRFVKPEATKVVEEKVNTPKTKKSWRNVNPNEVEI